MRLQAGGHRTLQTSLKPTEEVMAYQSIEVRKLTPTIGEEPDYDSAIAALG